MGQKLSLSTPPAAAPSRRVKYRTRCDELGEWPLRQMHLAAAARRLDYVAVDCRGFPYDEDAITRLETAVGLHKIVLEF